MTTQQLPLPAPLKDDVVKHMKPKDDKQIFAAISISSPTVEELKKKSRESMSKY